MESAPGRKRQSLLPEPATSLPPVNKRAKKADAAGQALAMCVREVYMGHEVEQWMLKDAGTTHDRVDDLVAQLHNLYGHALQDSSTSMALSRAAARVRGHPLEGMYTVHEFTDCILDSCFTRCLHMRSYWSVMVYQPARSVECVNSSSTIKTASDQKTWVLCNSLARTKTRDEFRKCIYLMRKDGLIKDKGAQPILTTTELSMIFGVEAGMAHCGRGISQRGE